MTTEAETDEDTSAEDAIAHVALLLGFNELLKQTANLAEKVYYAMMFDKCKALAEESGAAFEDTSDDLGTTKIELQRIGIKLTRDDLPALRAAIAELEAQ